MVFDSIQGTRLLRTDDDMRRTTKGTVLKSKYNLKYFTIFVFDEEELLTSDCADVHSV